MQTGCSSIPSPELFHEHLFFLLPHLPACTTFGLQDRDKRGQGTFSLFKNPLPSLSLPLPQARTPAAVAFPFCPWQETVPLYATALSSATYCVPAISLLCLLAFALVRQVLPLPCHAAAVRACLLLGGGQGGLNWGRRGPILPACLCLC